MSRDPISAHPSLPTPILWAVTEARRRCNDPLILLTAGPSDRQLAELLMNELIVTIDLEHSCPNVSLLRDRVNRLLPQGYLADLVLAPSIVGGLGLADAMALVRVTSERLAARGALLFGGALPATPTNGEMLAVAQASQGGRSVRHFLDISGSWCEIIRVDD